MPHEDLWGWLTSLDDKTTYDILLLGSYLHRFDKDVATGWLMYVCFCSTL